MLDKVIFQIFYHYIQIQFLILFQMDLPFMEIHLNGYNFYKNGDLLKILLFQTYAL